MLLLGLYIAFPEILVILVLGILFFLISLLPSICMFLMGHPLQALLCLALQLLILDYPAAVVWVVLVYLYDRMAAKKKNILDD